MEHPFTCGYPDQWKAFQQRNYEFLARLDNLEDAFKIAFVRSFDSQGPEATTIFTLGCMCVEEFHEIALFAGNGYGFGALRLLRSLYERAVTMAFLSDSPDQVDAFLNYDAVAKRRAMRAAREVFGQDIVSDQQMAEVEQRYAEVKRNYEVTTCKACGKRGINYTWHKLNFVEMAKKTIFGKQFVWAYYYPMSQVHSTAQALLSRLAETDGGVIGFDRGLQPERADEALIAAHLIILGVLLTQLKYFNLEQLDAPLQRCQQDYKEIWKTNGNGSETVGAREQP